MASLLFRNLVFTILQPGIVAGLIPYWILGKDFHTGILWPFRAAQYPGLLLFIFGFYLMMDCILRFAVHGRGTLSPADPTKKLVISGWYKYSRNPMYVGVLLILIGEALFFSSFAVAWYSLVVLIAFTIFIVLVEEPRLRRDFGTAYVAYCEKVRRWI